MLVLLLLLARPALAAADPTEPALMLAALDDAHDGPVVGLSFDRELLSSVGDALAGRDVQLELSGWDPASASVAEGTCGLWFAQDGQDVRMETVGSCPEVTLSQSAVAQVEAAQAVAEEERSRSRASSKRGMYTNSVLVGTAWRKLNWSGVHKGLELSWRGARWRATHLGTDAHVLGGESGTVLGARAYWALSPLSRNLSGPFFGPALGTTSGRWAESYDASRGSRTTIDPGWTVGWRVPWHPGFTLEAAWSRGYSIALQGPAVDHPATDSFSLLAGWSLAPGDAPRADPDNLRRTLTGLGITAGVALVVGGVLVGVYASAMSGLPIGG